MPEVVRVFLPTGHCTHCQVADRALTNLDRPTILQTGVVNVVGTCSVCQTRASGMINAYPYEELPEVGLDPTVVALLSTGLREGFRCAATAYNTKRSLDMLRVYLMQDLSIRELGHLFNLGRDATFGYLAQARKHMSQ